MGPRPRPYVPDDLPVLITLIHSKWQPYGPQTVLHVGDLFWRLREPSYEGRLRVWEGDTGAVAAFGEWAADEAACTLDFLVHPAYYGTDITDRILDWAEAESSGRPLTTYAAETDAPLIAQLTGAGYERREHWINCHTASLESSPPAPQPPAGYSVRHLSGPEEIEVRVQGHRAGWQSEKMTVAWYKRLMATPGYRTELDCVIVGS